MEAPCWAGPWGSGVLVSPTGLRGKSPPPACRPCLLALVPGAPGDVFAIPEGPSPSCPSPTPAEATRGAPGPHPQRSPEAQQPHPEPRPAFEPSTSHPQQRERAHLLPLIRIGSRWSAQPPASTLPARGALPAAPGPLIARGPRHRRAGGKQRGAVCSGAGVPRPRCAPCHAAHQGPAGRRAPSLAA